MISLNPEHGATKNKFHKDKETSQTPPTQPGLINLNMIPRMVLLHQKLTNVVYTSFRDWYLSVKCWPEK